jgi:hypothetical protein
MHKPTIRSPESKLATVEASAESWRAQTLLLRRENTGLKKRVAELEKELVGRKYRVLDGRRPGRGR